jgi:SOS-response transcriptional repressor LexA
MRNPTERQLEILQFIADQKRDPGICPTVREIGTHFGISSLRGVTVHLEALEQKGLIVRLPKSRSISVTYEGHRVLGSLWMDVATELARLGATYRLQAVKDGVASEGIVFKTIVGAIENGKQLSETAGVPVRIVIDIPALIDISDFS